MNDYPAYLPISKGRFILAVYLDILLFSPTWEVGWYLVTGGESAFLVKFIVFSIVETVMLYRFGSPGMRFMNIRRLDDPDEIARFQYNPFQKILYVVPEIKRFETWYTILFAVILINSGAKEFARWTMWSPPQPCFGLITDSWVGYIPNMITGGIAVYIAWLVLHLKKSAIYWGFTTLALSVTSVIVSWNLWDEYIARYLTQRYEYQGRTLHGGEIEFSQALMPEALIVGLVLMAVYLFFVSRKMKY
ncbi:MAG: hypothetical protein R3F48_03400 [Candidatus Zixiibacteriota bacterium]